MAWEQLSSILAEAASYAQEERSARPTACPHDGEPLRQASNGIVYCPLGNYEFPRDGRLI